MVMFGLIGGPLALIARIGVLLGAWGMHDGLPVLATAPEAIWELSLSVWAADPKLPTLADPHRSTNLELGVDPVRLRLGPGLR